MKTKFVGYSIEKLGSFAIMKIHSKRKLNYKEVAKMFFALHTRNFEKKT